MAITQTIRSDLILITTILTLVTGQQPRLVLPLAITEVRQETIFYETTAKVIFKVELPVRTRADLLVTELSICTSESGVPNSFCPLQFYLQNAADVLQRKLTPGNLKLQSSILPYYDENGHICDKIVPHFPAKTMTSAAVEEYLLKLEGCPAPTYQSPAVFLPDDVSTQYRAAMTEYSLVYWMLPRSVDQNATHAAVNAGLINTGFLHHLSEKVQWSEAISSCAAGQLPVALIAESVLEQALNQLMFKLADTIFEISIPHAQRGTTPYYSLPLTDCTFQEGTDYLIVRLLVPLVSHLTDWTLMEAKSIPFRHTYNNSPYLCMYGADDFQLETGKTFAYDRTAFPQTKSYSRPDCNNKLNGVNICHVNQKDGLPFKKSCLQYSIEYDESDLDKVLKYCPLICEPLGDFNLPVVQQISSDEFYIAGNNNESAELVCDGQPSEYVNLPEVGSLYIKLKCSCRLVFNSKEITPARPCGDESVQEIVIPINLQYKT